MADDTTQWQELEAFSKAEPSPLAFRALAGLLAVWRGDDREAAYTFAARLLERWPDSTRRAPWSWGRALLDGTPVPAWRLARTAALTSRHLTKSDLSLPKLAACGATPHLPELQLPGYAEHRNLACLHHHPDAFPALRALKANDNREALQVLAEGPLWRQLTSFQAEDLDASLFHRGVSRIAPAFPPGAPLAHVTLGADDLIAAWERGPLPHLEHVSVFIRSDAEARALATRPEWATVRSLAVAFRCGFSGSSPFEPYVGNVIAPDDTAAHAFFSRVSLPALRDLSLVGYAAGYWGREGLGPDGLDAVIAAGILPRLRRLHLRLLPLGDEGVVKLAPHLAPTLTQLELVDVYCRSRGARELARHLGATSLERLDLSGNRIGPSGIAALATVSLPSLTELDLSGPAVNPYYFRIGQQPVLDEGARALAEGPLVASLRSLRLRNTFLGNAGAVALFGAAALSGLAQLDLAHNAISARALGAPLRASHMAETLSTLELADCRIDDEGARELTTWDRAPALRSLGLGYNALGPRGAQALADWAVTGQLWRLDLHDNFIGDAGLIALARSPHTARLVELDVEQDVWNSHRFDFDDAAADAVAASTSLTRLDAFFSGCVDEYHGGAISPGFSKAGIRTLTRSSRLRVSARAACRDFSGVTEWTACGPFTENRDLHERDFRAAAPTLNEAEASVEETRLQERSPRPPKRVRTVASLSAEEVALDDPDTLKGIEHARPAPQVDHRLTLTLPLLDDDRPLPPAASKVFADVLDRHFRAHELGTAEGSGSMSEEIDGEYVATAHKCRLAIRGSVDAVLPAIRDALWWLGAPHTVSVSEYTDDGFLEPPLELQRAPNTTGPRLLQLASVKTARWRTPGREGYRLDRVPLLSGQVRALREGLDAVGAPEAVDGWSSVDLPDGGRVNANAHGLGTDPDVDTVVFEVVRFTPDVSRLIDRLMRAAQLSLWPMMWVPSEDVAARFDAEWPKVRVLADAAELHRGLAAGAYDHWRRA